MTTPSPSPTRRRRIFPVGPDNPRHTTLIIDDDPTFNKVLTRAFRRRGLEAFGAESMLDALEKAARLEPGQVVLDLNLAGDSGLLLIPKLLSINPESRIVVLTGYANITTAVEAIKLGAVQYLAKPAEVENILKAFSDKQAGSPSDKPIPIDRLEWEHIQRVLRENKGNVSATARALKMHRRTLQRKLLKRSLS